jgi:hypothetical protein
LDFRCSPRISEALANLSGRPRPVNIYDRQRDKPSDPKRTVQRAMSGVTSTFHNVEKRYWAQSPELNVPAYGGPVVSCRLSQARRHGLWNRYRKCPGRCTADLPFMEGSLGQSDVRQRDTQRSRHLIVTGVRAGNARGTASSPLFWRHESGLGCCQSRIGFRLLIHCGESHIQNRCPDVA